MTHLVSAECSFFFLFFRGGCGLELKILLQGFLCGGSNRTLNQSSHASSEFFFLSICLDDDEDFDATFCISDVVFFLHYLCPQSIVGYVLKLLNSKKPKCFLEAVNETQGLCSTRNGFRLAVMRTGVM